jgi:hypothetical protein
MIEVSGTVYGREAYRECLADREMRQKVTGVGKHFASIFYSATPEGQQRRRRNNWISITKQRGFYLHATRLNSGFLGSKKILEKDKHVFVALLLPSSIDLSFLLP